MNELKQCYEVLEIPCNASIEEIKQAYKELAQIWHPDRYAHNPRLQQKAEAKFKKINLSYQNLMEHLEEPTSDWNSKPSQEEFQTDAGNDNLSNEDWVGKFFKNLLKLPELKDQLVLKSEVKQFPLGVFGWKAQCLSVAGATGAASGILGPLGWVALPVDLAMCEYQATRGAFGIGHLLGCQVDYELDGDMILAIWTREGTLAKSVPAGKVGIKINDKPPSISVSRTIMGVIISKSLAKGSAKLLAKLSLKLTAKASAKLLAKIGGKTLGGAIPAFGAVFSGGINVWLVGGFLDAAEQYYSAQKSDQAVYLVFKDNVIASEL